jgi:dihydrofolate reductase
VRETGNGAAAPVRRLVYYVAVTLDGFIAREDGSFDAFPWDDEFGAALLARFPETFPAAMRTDDTPNQRFGAVLMGRRTYEVGLRDGITSPYPTLDQYVFSRSMARSPDPAVTLVRDDAVGAVRGLKAQDGADVWLCGGGELAGALFRAGLVDELILKLNPIVLGTGRPLVAGAVGAGPLELIDTQRFASGHMILRYAVRDRATPRPGDPAASPSARDTRGTASDGPGTEDASSPVTRLDRRTT